jgi:hypothetical protein
MPKTKKKFKKKFKYLDPHTARFIEEKKSLEKRFTSHIEHNDLLQLDELLSVDSNINLLKESRFMDPFGIAIKANNLNLIEYLNDKGFKLQSKSESPENHGIKDEMIETKSLGLSHCRALIEAIKCSNESAVDILIRLNINVNSSNYKFVPLQIAYNIYSCEKEKSLLEANFDTQKLNVRKFEIINLKF